CARDSNYWYFDVW
nr:immunoglobulin heavy chain junction region [Mus musculus]